MVQRTFILWKNGVCWNRGFGFTIAFAARSELAIRSLMDSTESAIYDSVYLEL